jgi:hypothetical protein
MGDYPQGFLMVAVASSARNPNPGSLLFDDPELRRWVREYIVS